MHALTEFLAIPVYVLIMICLPVSIILNATTFFNLAVLCEKLRTTNSKLQLEATGIERRLPLFTAKNDLFISSWKQDGIRLIESNTTLREGRGNPFRVSKICNPRRGLPSLGCCKSWTRGWDSRAPPSMWWLIIFLILA